MRWTVPLALLALASACRPAVADFLYVADAQSGVVMVDPATGAQTLVSSGSSLTGATGIAVEKDGDLLVTGIGMGALVQVDPRTGQQTVLASGGYLSTPFSIALSADGSIFIADAGPSGGSSGRIIEVNPATGSQTLISTGGFFEGVRDVAVQKNGTLLVGDRGYLSGDGYADGSIIQVDPTTGNQTYFSYGDELRDPDHLTIAPNGDIYVADRSAYNGNNLAGAVFRLDATTGAQTLISNDGYFTGGPTGIAVAPNGSIYVSNGQEIVGVDPSDGSQTIVSEGWLVRNPWAMAYVTTAPEPSSLSFLATGTLALLTWGWRRASIRQRSLLPPPAAL